MIRKKWFTLFVLIGIVFAASCNPRQINPTPEANMPNPASVHCEQNGGKVEFRQDASGGVFGMCVFPDGSECDEWAYFRGECRPGDSLVTPAGQSSRPSNPVAARDAVLAYLVENYGGEAPAAGLAWRETHTKPEGLVGGESYEYTAGDWVIAVSYPVVAPENVVYTIVVSNQATSFCWEGQVDARGQVTQTSAMTEPASDGWKTYRNRTLGYRFDYPADASVSSADDPLKTVTITGPLVGDEYWPIIFINHPSDRDDYRPPEGADLIQWLIDHNLLPDERQPDIQIAGATAIHTRRSRSPQSYASDSYYFARFGQLYTIVILHTGDKEDWTLYYRFLVSFQFDQ
jgi:putative hemolysin